MSRKDKMTAHNVMFKLWESTAKQLSSDDLEWFAEAEGLAMDELENLSTVMMGIGCLVNSDERAGNFQRKESVATLLFNLNHQVETISGLLHIANSATDRLNHPDIYSLIDKQKPEHS